MLSFLSFFSSLFSSYDPIIFFMVHCPPIWTTLVECPCSERQLRQHPLIFTHLPCISCRDKLFDLVIMLPTFLIGCLGNFKYLIWLLSIVLGFEAWELTLLPIVEKFFLGPKSSRVLTPDICTIPVHCTTSCNAHLCPQMFYKRLLSVFLATCLS